MIIKKREKLKTEAVRLAPDTAQRVREIANAMGVRKSEVLRAAVEFFLQHFTDSRVQAPEKQK